MIDQDKKNTSALIFLLIFVLAVFVILDWASFTQLLPSNLLLKYFHKSGNKLYMFRAGYVILLWLSCYLMPGMRLRRSLTENWKIFSCSFALLFSVLIIIGPRASEIYNKICYPIIFILHIPLVALSILSLISKNLKSEVFFQGVSNLKSQFYFEFETEDGTLTINSPQQNIWIDGGPGSGKSGTFINSIITQAAIRGYPGWVYDWEGDPTQEGSPILGKIAYGAILEAKKRNEKLNLEFAFINFTDMMRTVRVNVLSSNYYRENNASLFIKNMVTSLMKNLEPAWKEKTDFWANNAINYVYSVAYKCYKDRDLGINTLPHVISICLSDCDTVFNWIKEDKEISKNMASMISAWELGASQQTAGAVSSAQLPLALMNNKYIYWVLSPKPSEEFSLDITNKKKPVLLCVGNAPSIKQAISPAISCIANIVMTQMNQPGKAKSIFCNDEIPTVNLFGIDEFSSTARKHYVSTILAVQTFEQAQRDYGKESAKTLQANCGNQFFGMTGSNETAESIEKLLGEIKEINYSYSNQSSGEGSESESLQREKVLRARDVAGQPTGHFFGKIANGKPPYLYTQFKYFPGYSTDIPPFAQTIYTKDEKKDRGILENIIEKNYDRIENETEAILAPFRKNNR